MAYTIAPQPRLAQVPGVALVVSDADGAPLPAELGPVSGDRLTREVFKNPSTARRIVARRAVKGTLWERVAARSAVLA